MKVSIPVQGIILIKEETQFEIAYAFMRLQEFYEHRDSNRQGKFFNLDQVIENYATTGPSKNFTYLEDWAGFNVRGDVVTNFYDMYKDDLTPREEKLFDAIHKTLEQEEYAKYEDEFYVIGIFSDVYLDHELCHAMWSLYPEFKESSSKIIKSLDPDYYDSIKNTLLKAGYSTNVIDDEINAYIATSDMYYIKQSVFPDLDTEYFDWDKIYEFVENYWEFKEENLIEESEQLVKLTE